LDKPKVTFTITSTNRLDLLEITINSFLKQNSYPIEKYILVEDSGVPEAAETIKKKWPFFEVIANNPKKGQTASIDAMYARVETPYIFHCEDDWKFTRPDFIDHSMAILEKPGNEKIVQVWIRGEKDTNGHPVLKDQKYEADGVEYYLLSTDYYMGCYGGFGFHPGLRRLCDWQLIGSYTEVSGGEVEYLVSTKYIELGYAAATLLPSYMDHTGYGRHSDREGLI